MAILFRIIPFSLSDKIYRARSGVLKVAPNGIITTVAGTGYVSGAQGQGGYNGDNIAATSAELSGPMGVAVDGAGNLYIADYYNERIRKVDAIGNITTVAGNGYTTGNGLGGYNGDNIPATVAELNGPSDVAVDGAGNLYIADEYNNRARKVTPAGNITTVAGTGIGGYNGDNIAASSAELYWPASVAVDAAGNLYIGDINNERVRKVTLDGTITTMAGGAFVYNVNDVVAPIYPEGVAVDSAGNLYIADEPNQRISKVDVSDAPSLIFASTDAGAASAAQDVTVLNLGNAPLTVSQISTAANFSLGGADTTCSSTGQALASAASCVLGIEFNPATAGSIGGVVVLTDNTLNTPGSTQQVALSVNGLAAGTPPTATPTFPLRARTLPQPEYVTIADATPGAMIFYTVDGSIPTVDGSNPTTQVGASPVSVPVANPFVATQINAIASSPVNTVSAMATASFTVEPIGIQQTYMSPATTIGSPFSFNVEIFLNEGQTIMSLSVSASQGGVPEFIAGSPICNPGSLGGTVCTVPITFQPAYPGLRQVPLSVRTSLGTSYGSPINTSTTNFALTGIGQAPLAALDPGLITTVAGNGNMSTTLSGPGGLSADGLGDLGFADTISTVAGVAGVSCMQSAEGGLATSTPLCNPTALAVDAAGDLYISSSNRIQRVEIGTGAIWPLAGTGNPGYTGDGGAATSAMLNNVQGLALDPVGNLYVSDYGNAVVREISAGAPPLNFAGTNVGSNSSSQHEAVINIGNLPLQITSAALGTSNFAFSENTCAGATLAPGISCVTMVQFSPQSGGVLGDTVTFTDNSLNTSAATQQVQLSGVGNVAQASTIVSASSVSIPFYNPAHAVTLTANVGSAVGVVNEGTVNFTVGTLGLTSSAAVVNGTATATVTIPVDTYPGVFTITAAFTGTSNYSASSDPTQSLTITQATTTTTLSSSLNPSAFGQSVTLTAVINLGGYPPNTGSVTFFDGATNLGTVTQSGGQASLPLVVGSLSAGTHSLTAQYSGNFTHAGSISAVLTQTVNPGVSSQSFVPALTGSSTSTDLTYSFSNLSAAPTFALAYGLEFTVVPNICSGTGTVLCNLSVRFTPLYPGLRQDALVIKDGSGNVLQTTLLSGVGLAPRAVLVPDLINTYAGGGSGCAAQTDSVGDGCTPASAQFNLPFGVALDPAGNLYIGDSVNSYVRKVSVSTGTITAVAGNGSAVTGGDGGQATSAQLNDPGSLAVDGAGNLYIAERSSNLVRMVNGATGVITTVAGGGVSVPGVGIVCGAGQTDSIGDGCLASSAQLNLPSALAVDTVGNLYIADVENHGVRMVNAGTSVITTYAGGGSGCPQQTDSVGDGCPASSAQLSLPYGIGFDTEGNLYIADAGSGLIRKVSATTNVISTVLQSTAGSTPPTGAPTSTLLQSPHGVAVDAAGNVYITDEGTQRVIKFESASGIYTEAGNGIAYFSGDGGPATSAQLNDPSSVAVDTAGNVYIADVLNNRIRIVGNSGEPLIFAQTNTGSSSATQMAHIANTGNTPLTLTGFTPSANFSIDPTATTCSIASPLAVGHSCAVGVIFAPTTGGVLNGTLTISDNSLNATGSSQQVQLSGVGYAVQASTVTASSSVSVPFFNSVQNITLAASVKSANGAVSEGTVTFTVGALNLTASAPVVNGIATASVVVPASSSPGVLSDYSGVQRNGKLLGQRGRKPIADHRAIGYNHDAGFESQPYDRRSSIHAHCNRSELSGRRAVLGHGYFPGWYEDSGQRTAIERAGGVDSREPVARNASSDGAVFGRFCGHAQRDLAFE